MDKIRFLKRYKQTTRVKNQTSAESIFEDAGWVNLDYIVLLKDYTDDFFEATLSTGKVVYISKEEMNYYYPFKE